MAKFEAMIQMPLAGAEAGDCPCCPGGGQQQGGGEALQRAAWIHCQRVDCSRDKKTLLRGDTYISCFFKLVGQVTLCLLTARS